MNGPEPPSERLLRDRFTIVRQLGAGGMGTVYDALDRRVGRRCALKVLKHFSGQSLYRFKREFRSLAEIRHRNLIRLGELHGEGTDWFFTMELIEGIDWLSYVRGRVAAPSVSADDDTVEGSLAARADLAPVREARVGTYVEHRLRATLPQIAVALRVLHEHGKIHRDLKPSNVLVTETGRVVLLDFGLVVDADQEASLRRTEMHVVGTASYMSPEQASAKPTTEATDWYALGVMLFEALTGELPFSGNPYVMLTEKVSKAPPRPSELCASVPADLDELCHALLRTRPEERPSGAALLAELAVEPSSLTLDSGAFAIDDPPPFLGRTSELETLRSAFRTTEHAQGAAVLVVGEPGIGKSALVERFADELVESRPDVVVLRGRCRAHELVPFRAFDEVVDELSHQLRTVPEKTLGRWLDADVVSLAQVFPVLERVEAISRRLERVTKGDVSELRGRAFRSLRNLLRSIHDDRHLVLVFEDLQWADADSTRELAELFEADPAPGFLVIATSRPVARDEALAIPAPHELGLPSSTRVVALDRLDDSSTRALLGSAMPDASPELLASGIATSRGHPLHALEIARASLRPAGPDAGSLEEVAWERVERLSPPHRKLLFTMALAGVPLDEGTLSAASELPLGAALEALSDLLSRHFVILHETMQGARWDLHHERVATMLRARIAPEEAYAARQRIVAALLASEFFGTRHDLVATQLLALAERAPAAQRFVAAARSAESAGAFARAAELARLALETDVLDDEEALAMQELAGRCLQVAGYLPEAGAAYQRAAELAREPLVRARLYASAARAYASTYDTAAAEEAAERALALVGRGLPRTTPARIAHLVGYAALAGASALVPRRARRPDDARSQTLRVIHWVYLALGIVAYVRGDRLLASIALFGVLHAGRRLGPSRELIQTEHMRGMIAASVGNRFVVRRQIERIRALARAVPDPWATSSAGFANVLLSCVLGQYPGAEQEASRTELSGKPLDAFEHLAMTTRIGFVLGLLGRHREASAWFRRGLGRLAPTVENAFVRSVRTTEVFERAMLGEDVAYEPRVDQELATADPRSAAAFTALGSALIHALATDPGSPRTERLLTLERSLQTTSGTITEEAHVPRVLAAYLTFERLFAAPDAARADAFAAALRRARSARRWPILRPHLLVLRAAARLDANDRAGARKLAQRALDRAEASRNAFAGYEACRLLARIESASGNAEAALARLAEARALAAGHGWVLRARRLDADELALRRLPG